MEDGKVLAGQATPRGRYPHLRRAGDFIYVSGTSARRPDNTIAGAVADAMGTTALDIRVQTRAVIETIRDMLDQLPHPHILIEIQAVAYVPQGGRR